MKISFWKDDEVKKLLTIIENINNAWQGNEASAYITEMKEKYIIELEKIVEIIEEYGLYLEKIPEAYSILDEVFSSKEINV